MFFVNDHNGGHTMLTYLKIALSVAVVLGTASAGLAAPKHAVRHQTTRIQLRVPVSAYTSFGAVAPANSFHARANAVNQPSNFTIQDIGYNESLGN
jgi:hypothetical protein